MNFIGKKFLSRRHFIRGAGYCIALPFLDAMIPAMARAATIASPLRVAYLYFPHGTHPVTYSWKASTTGTGFQFPAGLAASNLVALKQEILLLGGLFNPWSPYAIYNDPDNDHPSAVASYLTGARANWAAPNTNFTLSTNNAKQGVPLPEDTSVRSVDVAIAEKIAGTTKIPVLHLTPAGFAPYDGGTAKYNVDYRTYLSWKNSNTATPRFDRPSAAFTALFGGGSSVTPPSTQTLGPDLNSRKKSILDLALADANSLRATLGPSDRIKIDEYLSSVRDVERTIQSSPQPQPPATGPVTCNPVTTPSDSGGFDVITKANLDLMVLAFQCDQSRVAAYMLDYELNSRNYSFAGATKYDGHQASHGGFAGNFADAFKITTWYANQFAYLINRMKSVSDANGTLLSQSILHLGSGTNTNDGDHPDQDLPMVIAGQGGGLLTTGRAMDAKGARISNYHLSLLQKIGVNATSFGNSNGTISGL